MGVVNNIRMFLQGKLTADGGCYGAGEYDTGSETLVNQIVQTHLSLTLEHFKGVNVDGTHALILDKTSTEDSGYDTDLGVWYLDKEEQERCEDSYEELYQAKFPEV